MNKQDVFINGFGSFLPGQPIVNKDMEDYLGYIDGKPSRYRAPALRQNKIKTRHYALSPDGKSKYSSAEMAAQAIQDAVKKSEINLGAITYLATSSTLGDVLVPGLASHVHAELGLAPIEIANFQSVCASSFMALKSAYTQIKAGEHACAAVSGSEFSSRYFRPGFYEQTMKAQKWDHVPYEAEFLRFTLSDGAGAALLEGKPNEKGQSLKIHWIDIKSYADRFETCMLAGGVKQPDGIKHWSNFDNLVEASAHGSFILMQDFNLLKKMIPVWVSHYLDLIDQEKIVIDDIDHVCSHYSSHSLREETMSLLRKAGAMIDEEKWFTNLYTKGNTGTASIFIMLDELFHGGKLKSGEKILCHVPESGRGLNCLMLLEVL
ncbi:MAG: 3-oxoacyl-ACP synthase [Alphaproteobacteria bacterium]|nr:3-oxoacyl-ACP synthase [Alphaproteobacteria bacterium]